MTVKKDLAIQALKFVVVGLINLGILLGVFNLLLLTSMHFLIAYSIAFIASVVNAFLLNKLFVFKKHEKQHLKTFVKVLICYLFTLALSNALLYVEVDLLNLDKNLSTLINVMITTPINFCLNKFWAFSKARQANRMETVDEITEISTNESTY